MISTYIGRAIMQICFMNASCFANLTGSAISALTANLTSAPSSRTLSKPPPKLFETISGCDEVMKPYIQNCTVAAYAQLVQDSCRKLYIMSLPLNPIIGGWRRRGSSVDRASPSSSKRSSMTISSVPQHSAAIDSSNCEAVSRAPRQPSPDKRRSCAKHYIGAIKSELYIRKGSVLVKSGSTDSGVGQIRLRLQYDFHRSDLIVQIIEVTNLSSTSPKCYAKILMITEDFETFRKLEGILDGESYTFQEKAKIPVASDELSRSTLKILLFENAYGTKFIGDLELDLLENDPSAEVEVVADIENRARSDMFSFAEVCPPLFVEEHVSGELQVAVKYLPNAERMVVTILETRGMDILEVMRLMGKLPKGHFWKITNTIIGEIIIGENSPLLSGRKQWKSVCKDGEETTVWHRLIKYERSDHERRYSR
ncbi:unnamed protein product [Soboliphyme baturini]|uniref:C2 domain-containing protein n=1 Tax=Soboliphyme baturini TaxID=241478 RepID=A0A183IJW2_9BILA|nr:unnamed protein product [Soboliphyme baturini]